MLIRISLSVIIIVSIHRNIIIKMSALASTGSIAALDLAKVGDADEWRKFVEEAGSLRRYRKEGRKEDHD